VPKIEEQLSKIRQQYCVSTCFGRTNYE